MTFYEKSSFWCNTSHLEYFKYVIPDRYKIVMDNNDICYI